MAAPKVLVTGGAGFVGSYVVRDLLRAGAHPVVLDSAIGLDPLALVVPAVASWRLAGLPIGLTRTQVRALLGACDQSTAVGRRDFAIVTLLARLGLRAGEAAALTLDDIDWRAGTLTVHGKANSHEQLPLPVDVGFALSISQPARASGLTPGSWTRWWITPLTGA